MNQPATRSYFAHETAVIDEGAIVGTRTRIWHFCHVSDGAVIGERCVLGQNVFVAGRARLGDGVKVQNNVSIYDEVVLENEVFCGPSMVFTNVGTPRAFVDRKHAYQPTRVMQGATLGANCTIVCGVTIGRYALVGAGAVVTHDVPDYGLFVGVPARQKGWVCRCGVPLLSSSGAAGVTALYCPECSSRYQQNEGAIELLEATA